MPRTKRKTAQANAKARVPTEFRPRFYEHMDNRLAAVREIKSMVADLARDSGADSIQKRILCERAAFLVLLLRSQEIEHLEGKPFDSGSWTQQVNALSGILSKLGLKAVPKKVAELEEYVNGEWQ